MEELVNPGEIPRRCVFPGVVVERLLVDGERYCAAESDAEEIAAVDVAVAEPEPVERFRHLGASWVRRSSEPHLEVVRRGVVRIDEHALKKLPDVRARGRFPVQPPQDLDGNAEL